MTDAQPQAVPEGDTAAYPAVAPVAQPGANVNVTALFGEAVGKSGILWVEDPDGKTWPVWHAWADNVVYVVSGPGEQALPTLPGSARLILRSKDSGGRLLTVNASAEVVTPEDRRWATAVAALRATRLNAVDDLEARWRAECVIQALTPFGMPDESPGAYGSASGARQVVPAAGTTGGWRPWHLGGRKARRSKTR